MLTEKRLRNIEDFPEFDNHEEVLFFSDKKSGLRSFVAMHSTILGPATGGTRCFHYRSELDALKDALRLSRSMTYKCALAGVPFGGGKGVILLRADQKKTSALITAYAEKINTLDGRFSTGEDVGLTEHDVSIMEKVSPYINGPRASGELGPWAALGVFMAMKSALKELFGSSSFENRTFAIKGVGKVGSELCALIDKNGGQLVVSDIDPVVIKRVKKNYPRIRIVSPQSIHREKVDVYAPCAMGNEFNLQNISEVRSQIICGAANNQLAVSAVGKKAHDQGILYIPDYVANAGGLINAVAHLIKGSHPKSWVKKKVSDIEKTTSSLIALSKKLKKPTSEVSDHLAEVIIKKHKNKK